MRQKIFVYLWDATDDYCIKSYYSDGTFIKNVMTSATDFMTDDADVMCVDIDNNVYYCLATAGYNIIRKVDSDGTLLLEKDLGSGVGLIVGICAGSDGYIYGLEKSTDFANNNYYITKRSKVDLSLIDSVDLGSTGDREGFVCDSDGYIYFADKSDWSIRKWNMTAQQATRVVTYSRGLSHAGSLVGGISDQAGSKSAWTIPDALNEDKTIWNLDGIAVPIATSSIGDNFIYGGSLKIARYKNDKTKVWEITISADNTVYQVAAYPFVVPPTVTTQPITNY